MNKNIFKVTILILIITIAFMTIPKVEYAAETETKIGDIDGDGIIDTRDRTKISQYIAAMRVQKIAEKHPDWILSDAKFKAADINEDGVIDARDTSRVLRYIAAKVPKIKQKHPDWRTYIESKWTVEATGITLDKTSLTIEKGKTTKLTATITPTNVTEKVVTWSSSDTKVATVDGIGNVEGKSAGIAIITATTKNGKTASCEVKVTETTVTPTTPTVTTKNINNTIVTLSTTAVTYNGKLQTPSVTVKDGNTTLKNGTDYTVSYANNKNAGTATVTITGKGKYTGAIAKNFKINKANYDMSKVKFPNVTVTYDGKAHLITATGLPTGVKVTYTNNGKTVAGTYKVTAKFTGDATNYNIISDKTAFDNGSGYVPAGPARLRLK